MRVLLTGSSGWLGRFLSPMLAALGHEVIGLDIAASASTDVIGSVANRPLIEGLFAKHKFEGIIHAAALHKPDIARYPRQAFIDVNVCGTLNLLEVSVKYGVSSFVFTSTTSLMISQDIRDETSQAAVWLDEESGPLMPRNVYGVTKLAAENICRLVHNENRLPTVILRTSRFFPEEDDTLHELTGENLKANEFLNRRLTVEDCARAHIVALEKAPQIKFGLYIVSAPPPFTRASVNAIKARARDEISRLYPQAPAIYAKLNWKLPTTLGRVYDPTLIERDLGFRCKTDFAAILNALESGSPMPFTHDPNYISPNASKSAPL